MDHHVAAARHNANAPVSVRLRGGPTASRGALRPRLSGKRSRCPCFRRSGGSDGFNSVNFRLERGKSVCPASAVGRNAVLKLNHSLARDAFLTLILQGAYSLLRKNYPPTLA